MKARHSRRNNGGVPGLKLIAKKPPQFYSIPRGRPYYCEITKLPQPNLHEQVDGIQTYGHGIALSLPPSANRKPLDRMRNLIFFPIIQDSLPAICP